MRCSRMTRGVAPRAGYARPADRADRASREPVALASKAEGAIDAAMDAVDLGHQVKNWRRNGCTRDREGHRPRAGVRPAVVHGNAFLLRELLSNLLDNAIRHTPQGGRVTVRAHARDGRTIVEVEDEGAAYRRPTKKRVPTLLQARRRDRQRMWARPSPSSRKSAGFTVRKWKSTSVRWQRHPHHRYVHREHEHQPA